MHHCVLVRLIYISNIYILLYIINYEHHGVILFPRLLPENTMGNHNIRCISNYLYVYKIGTQNMQVRNRKVFKSTIPGPLLFFNILKLYFNYRELFFCYVKNKYNLAETNYGIVSQFFNSRKTQQLFIISIIVILGTKMFSTYLQKTTSSIQVSKYSPYIGVSIEDIKVIYGRMVHK